MSSKLNKSEAEAYAKNVVRNNSEVNALTVERLEGMEWQERRDLAKNLADAASAPDTKYHEAFREAYASAVLNTWAPKVKGLENARKHFKAACTGLPLEKAHAKVKALVESMNIRGARIGDYGVEVLRGGEWNGPSLGWTFERLDGTTDNPDDTLQRVNHYRLELRISTGGSSYSIAKLALLHKVHGELLDAANELTVAMGNERIVSTWGFELPSDVVPVQAEAVQA